MKKVLAQWKDEYFPYQEREKLIDIPDHLETWHDMQQFFDPGYHCEYLKFWELLAQIANK